MLRDARSPIRFLILLLPCMYFRLWTFACFSLDALWVVISLARIIECGLSWLVSTPYGSAMRAWDVIKL